MSIWAGSVGSRGGEERVPRRNFSTLLCRVLARTCGQNAVVTKLAGFGILCTLLLLATAAFGQIDRGTIKGSVTDPSGAVIPDAKIQIVQTNTNSTIDLATDSQGLYNAPNLPAATYRITVSKEGFKTGVREPVEVRPTVQVQVDFQLNPGAVSETVQVTGEAPILDVSTTNNATGL